MRKLITYSKNWWILWGILSPLLFAVSCLSWLYIHPYFIIVEYIPSALFGLWIISEEKFKINCLKLFVCILLLGNLIFIFGYNATWIAPVILIVFMNMISLSKDEFLWSFGNTLLYGILGLIPISIVFFIEPLNGVKLDSLPLIITQWLGLLIVCYFLKGAIYGSLLHHFYQKRVA
jgi:hypothetical protein